MKNNSYKTTEVYNYEYKKFEYFLLKQIVV